MNTITTKWNVGQFDTELTVEVDEKETLALAMLGLRFLGQRNTEVDKILGGFEVVDGKSKRKADYQRNQVEYAEELATKLKESFSTLVFPDSTKDAPHKIEGVLVDISKYEGGTKEPAYAAEKRAIKEYLAANGGKLKDGATPRTVETFCANRGIEVPSDAAKYEEDTEFLTRVKAWLKSVAQAE